MTNLATSVGETARRQPERVAERRAQFEETKAMTGTRYTAIGPRTIMVRGLRCTVAALCAAAALAAHAQATVSVSSFSVTPSTLTAGGTSGEPGPDVKIGARFSTPDGDSPKDLRIALAPGLLANPTGVPRCSTSSFNAGICPSFSQIGSGSITGLAPAFGLSLSLPTYAYLIQSTGPEIARLGLIVYFFGFPVITQSAPISIRTSPSVGIDIPLTSLPNQLDGISVILTALDLTIHGSIGGRTFTRNPTSCSAATSTLTADSYGAPSTSTTTPSSFTPTGCSTVPYAPALSGAASVDSGDDGAGFAATMTQTYNEADNTKALLNLPASLSPRLSLLASACTNAVLSQCPAVGSATVATPLLPAPLTASVVLVAHAGSIPTLAILIPAPVNLRLNVTPIITGPVVDALLVGIPDIPLSSLTLRLPGGPTSLFRAGVHLCSSPQTVSGNFTAWSGAVAHPSAIVPVSGCPGGSPTTSATAASAVTTGPASNKRAARVAHGRSGHSAAGDRVVTFSRTATGRPEMTVVVGSGGRAPFSSVSIRMPNGLSVRSRQLADDVRVVLDGSEVGATATVKHGVLRLVLGRSGRVAIIRLSAPALRGVVRARGDL